mmetsp:Transcript_6986/g.17530  ORF Transcript_6986/g.17530 Transcript_6986/m.17530 type:complete len:683 (+) Transcript_6986:288-2336(+)|eukprot:CAMPEP_0172391634 /NCGR_PEP_ID=MMETSP1061-20121228/7988_1 /TAXON_ID=37318 /ORGANISM="Pseudo-nitzschia pungens, Strain cf. pungens" /LENGTH=682 /DNA_ID=CAMNT_0013122305 /DNA_START=277 /DNA_END=2325 /DNA_ORIENTATION=-
MTILAALDSFLDSEEANTGIRSMQVRRLISEIPGDEDEAFKYFVSIVVPRDRASDEGEKEEDELSAARSYRAMIMLKQDLAMPETASVLIKNPEQAGLLAKDLFAGLSVPTRKRYSTLHIRELLDTLLEVYPEKVMAAASAGGKQGIQEHLGPLLSTDQTLTVLTHLVCYGCTGRKGIASAEKSAQHTANLYHQNPRKKIAIGQRKKFVRACMDFQLMDRLAQTITASSTEADLGEEACEAILTMIELIGYPPEDLPPPQQQQQQQQQQRLSPIKTDEVSVGEEVLLSPLASSGWWAKLFDMLCSSDCTSQQRLAISRTCMQAFALATGNSSRICKSHAPATDATEQASGEVVDETEEKITNKLIDWGLTDKIYASLVMQLPLLVRALDLPDHDILNYQATFSTKQPSSDGSNPELPTIRHPGRYCTVPLGSWRLQLLALLKELVVYSGTANANSNANSNSNAGAAEESTGDAIEGLLKLPLPAELTKSKKQPSQAEASTPEGVYNPWPALCSYVWAYPNNDFYGIVFFEMLRSVVIRHHEPTLRVVLQKSKFLTKAIKSLANPQEPCSSVLLDCLNLLRLRAQSLSPSSFLPQYLNSHDGWKTHVDQLVLTTINQQTPIKNEGETVNIGLGSAYAKQLGLGDITEYDGSAEVPTPPAESETTQESGTKKKKKTNKKKKKKK